MCKKAWYTCRVVVLLSKPIDVLLAVASYVCKVPNESLDAPRCVVWPHRNGTSDRKAHARINRSSHRDCSGWVSLGSLSSDVFERRTSTGSEPFSLLVRLHATVFVLPSVLILIETICPKICSKSRLKCAKSPFPVDVRRSKTSLLKLPIIWTASG